ncbi:hypothetical protein M2138_000470 [Dysgonomonadaceae bacterium PH5-43]|nr:hypothetical protein [Dysgonomonadaceae bacterium PH5-43]
MHQLRKLHIPIKASIVLMFAYYIASVSFFSHSHVINCVTIVHSHPFAKDSEGNPTHQHTGTELQLIEHLSSIVFPAIIFVATTISILLVLKNVVASKNVKPFIPSNSEEAYRQRPPPYLI